MNFAKVLIILALTINISFCIPTTGYSDGTKLNRKIIIATVGDSLTKRGNKADDPTSRNKYPYYLTKLLNPDKF